MPDSTEVVQPPAEKTPAAQPGLFAAVRDAVRGAHPQYDYTVFMPRGVLEFLVTPARLAKLKARTEPKFWKRQKGYRTQYDPSYRKREARRTNVKFAFPIPPLKGQG